MHRVIEMRATDGDVDALEDGDLAVGLTDEILRLAPFIKADQPAGQHHEGTHRVHQPALKPALPRRLRWLVILGFALARRDRIAARAAALVGCTSSGSASSLAAPPTTGTSSPSSAATTSATMQVMLSRPPARSANSISRSAAACGSSIASASAMDWPET